MTVGMAVQMISTVVVAVQLLRQHVVARLAAVAEDGVQDEALDADEDDRRQAEDEQVEVEDLLAGLGLRLRRQHAAGASRATTSSTPPRRASVRIRLPDAVGLHQLVLAAPQAVVEGVRVEARTHQAG